MCLCVCEREREREKGYWRLTLVSFPCNLLEELYTKSCVAEVNFVKIVSVTVALLKD